MDRVLVQPPTTSLIARLLESRSVRGSNQLNPRLQNVGKVTRHNLPKHAKPRQSAPAQNEPTASSHRSDTRNASRSRISSLVRINASGIGERSCTSLDATSSPLT